MESFYKSGTIAHKLGVTSHTVRRWVARYPQFFSDTALAIDGSQSIYNAEEFVTLITIHHLSAEGYSLDMIEQKLTEGYRYQGALDNLIPPTRNISKARTTKSLETLLQQAQERIAELTAELTTTKYQLGVAEGELKAVKEYLLPNKK